MIVLRVLSKEEIEKLAERTAEIRGMSRTIYSTGHMLTLCSAQREREWQKQAGERQHSYRRERSHPDDEDDRERPQQLAIEAPPTTAPMDMRQLTGQAPHTAPPHGGYGPQQWSNPSSARNSGEQIPVPVSAGGMPRAPPQQIPEFDVSNYSQNV